jgi:hypothetical protein
MDIRRQKNGLRHFLAAVMCLCWILALPSPVSQACSWDYPIWMIRSRSADPFYRFIREGKAGYIDRFGKVVIAPTFEVDDNYGGEFHDGLMAPSILAARYVDTTGKEVIDAGPHGGEDFAEGLAPALYDGKWGYIDRSGAFAISPRFEDTQVTVVPGSFFEGLAAIAIDGKYGFIDRTGAFVIAPRFLRASDFHDGRARVIADGPCLYWYEEVCPGVERLGDGAQEGDPPCRYAFIDRRGELLSADRFDGAYDFSEGFAAVRVGDKWGYIDATGRMVVKPQFEDAKPFSDGLARVRVGDRYGFIDSSGAIIIRPQFEDVDDFSEGLAVIFDERDESCYYINKRGNQAIPERFSMASHFFKGLAHVRLRATKRVKGGRDAESTFAYIDPAGKRIFTYSYKSDD